MWEIPNCDNCGSFIYKSFLTNITTWEYEGKFNIVECDMCGLKYLCPRPKIKYIKKYYKSESYWGVDLTIDKNPIDKTFREKQYLSIYKKILRHHKHGSIFDVGAGTGLFLTKFKELGWVTGGNELSVEAVKYAKRNFHIDLVSGDFNKLQLNNKKYNVITFNSTLEHMYNPANAVKKAYKMLKKDGLVVITVPNIDSLGRKVFQKNWLPLHPPKHLYHFSSKTLADIVEKAGFSIAHKSFWYPNHAYYSIFQSFRYMLSPKFKRSRTGGLIKNTKSMSKKHINNLSGELAKIFATLATYALMFIGILISRGETITIYAKKS